MTEGMAAGVFGDCGGQERLLDRTLEHRHVKVMAAALAAPVVGIEAGGGEDPLPGPFSARPSVFFGECMGKRGVASALDEIPLVLEADAFEMTGEVGLEDPGQQGHSVFSAFAGSDDELACVEIDVFDAEVGAFEQAQAGAVEQRCHESGDGIELVEERLDFTRTEHDGQRDGSPCADEALE